MGKKQKERVGVVVSDKMVKTVTIAVETPKRHPLYKKTLKRYTKFKAHDENNQSKEGDTVRIVETRPLSKDKRWRVSEILAKGKVVQTKPQEINDAGTT